MQGPGEIDENAGKIPPVLAPPIPPCVLPPIQQEAEPAAVLPPRPWGFWATVAYTAIIGLVMVTAQGIIGAVAVLIATGGKMPPTHTLSSNGLLLGAATVGSAPLVVLLSVIFAGQRRQVPVREYLGLYWPSIGSIVRWVLGLLLFLAAADGVTVLLRKSVVPNFMVEVYNTAGWLPLLLTALVIAAPFGEEFMFRGFLFKGLAHTALRGWGAVFVTAAVWSAIHLQYDLYGIGVIFFTGLLLGAARLKTGSLWLCILLHSLMNFLATAELMIHLQLKQG